MPFENSRERLHVRGEVAALHDEGELQDGARRLRELERP